MFVEDKEKFILPLVVKKADPYTLEHLIQWLETRDPAEQYNWLNCHGECLIGQYQSYIGDDRHYCEFNDAWATANGFRLGRIASPMGTLTYPISTISAALLRARSFLQAEGGSP